jgi:hypothetical protein
MLRRVIRGIVKLIGVVVLLVLLLVGAFFLVNQFDEQLHPEFETFIKGDGTSVPDEENGYIALVGFMAPQGETMEAFGEELLQSDAKGEGEASRVTRVEFVGDAYALNCWIGKLVWKDKACASEEALEKMIADNQLLLTRLSDLYRYEQFAIQGFASVVYGQTLIETQQLMMAKLVRDARRGQGEQALQQWMENMRFTQNLLAGEGTVVEQAIYLVIRRAGIEAYSPIVSHLTAEQLNTHKAALSEIFAAPTLGKGGWDVASTMRAEFRSMFGILEGCMASPADVRKTCLMGSPIDDLAAATYLPNATRNLFYEFSQDMLALSSLPAGQVGEESLKLKREYLPATDREQNIFKILSGLLYNPIGKMVMGGVAAGSELLIAAHHQGGMLRVLALYTEAKTTGVKPEDMAAFVANAPAHLQNPFTNQPFGWNAEKQSITFTAPDNPLVFEVGY